MAAIVGAFNCFFLIFYFCHTKSISQIIDFFKVFYFSGRNQYQKKCTERQFRFPFKLRIAVYGYLIDMIKQFQPDLHIGLCMEEYKTFKALNMESTIACCNCVL